ncbi:MAG: hypothetical protein JSU01_05320 [Bacteroidetes bacterium]|nr:hypothetical protein [Bacteroidota bacterium]
MKKFLLACFFFLLAAKGFSQQFSQINTGTLYDSFENPSQRAFVPDTSKKYAFNFIIPNISGNFSLTGDAQASLISRAFGGKYNNAALVIGPGNYNNLIANGGFYQLMFKVFGSVKGDTEFGFFTETRFEGRGSFTDESIAALNGTSAFPNNEYNNVFNDHFYDQIYNVIGLTYREQVIKKRLSVGFRLGFLMGIDYSKLDIYESRVNFDQVNNAETISLRGRFFQSKGPGNFDARSLLPTTRSPGAQISMGATYKTDDNVYVQGNIKDLGFIDWYNKSSIADFNATQTATNLVGKGREDSVYSHVNSILKDNRLNQSFTTATDAKFELSATKSYWLNDDMTLKYSPTLIGSKELWYNGFAAGLVNHFEYLYRYHGSVTISYDNANLLNVGLQLMYKTHNGEFYIGSDKVMQTVTFAGARNNYSSYANSSFTGANFFMGFSMKFGPVIEHPLNSSVMETGERGFLGRLYNRLFKTNW